MRGCKSGRASRWCPFIANRSPVGAIGWSRCQPCDPRKARRTRKSRRRVGMRLSRWCEAIPLRGFGCTNTGAIADRCAARVSVLRAGVARVRSDRLAAELRQARSRADPDRARAPCPTPRLVPADAFDELSREGNSASRRVAGGSRIGRGGAAPAPADLPLAGGWARLARFLFSPARTARWRRKTSRRRLAPSSLSAGENSSLGNPTSNSRGPWRISSGARA